MNFNFESNLKVTFWIVTIRNLKTPGIFSWRRISEIYSLKNNIKLPNILVSTTKTISNIWRSTYKFKCYGSNYCLMYGWSYLKDAWRHDRRCFGRQSFPFWPFLQFKHEKLQSLASKHRKNCECCPGHYLIANHYSLM